MSRPRWDKILTLTWLPYSIYIVCTDPEIMQYIIAIKQQFQVDDFYIINP